MLAEGNRRKTELLSIALGGLLLLTPLLFSKAAWVGHKTLPVEVIVVDRNTGLPIAGASVHLGKGDMDYRSAAVRWNPQEPPWSSTTSTRGETTCRKSFTASGADYLWTRSGSVNFGPFCIQVSAPGYVSRATEFSAVAGRGRKDQPDDWPVHLSLALKRVKAEHAQKNQDGELLGR